MIFKFNFKRTVCYYFIFCLYFSNQVLIVSSVPLFNLVLFVQSGLLCLIWSSLSIAGSCCANCRIFVKWSILCNLVFCVQAGIIGIIETCVYYVHICPIWSSICPIWSLCTILLIEFVFFVLDCHFLRVFFSFSFSLSFNLTVFL